MAMDSAGEANYGPLQGARPLVQARPGAETILHDGGGVPDNPSPHHLDPLPPLLPFRQKKRDANTVSYTAYSHDAIASLRPAN